MASKKKTANTKKTTVFKPVPKQKLIKQVIKKLPKKLPYKLEKVVDPHKHMPNAVASAFLECCRELEQSNDSYVYWTVGGMADDFTEEDFEEEEVEDEFYSDMEPDGGAIYDAEPEKPSYQGSDWEKVDKWFLANGWKNGDTVFTLCWW